jgi:hypothetical protein
MVRLLPPRRLGQLRPQLRLGAGLQAREGRRLHQARGLLVGVHGGCWLGCWWVVLKMEMGQRQEELA